MRLIEADEAREKMLKLLDHHLMMCNYSADSATQDCIDVINEAAVVDAEPVVHGHWIWRKNHWECSVCRNNRFTNDIVLGLNSAYCSYCGAKMDDVMNNENK